MTNKEPFRPSLPEGWYYPSQQDGKDLHAELQKELPPGHLLFGIAVETFAWRDGATDDVLFHHVDQPERFTVIHLSWLGRTEINEQHPTVEFDGTFEAFIVNEEKMYGLKPPQEG